MSHVGISSHRKLVKTGTESSPEGLNSLIRAWSLSSLCPRFSFSAFWTEVDKQTKAPKSSLTPVSLPGPFASITASVRAKESRPALRLAGGGGHLVQAGVLTCFACSGQSTAIEPTLIASRDGAVMKSTQMVSVMAVSCPDEVFQENE